MQNKSPKKHSEGKNKNRYSHNCKFSKSCKTLDILFPKTMKCYKLRRKFREIMLISEENGRKCCTPMGNVGYVFAKEQHLNQNYYTIHPFSKFRQYWEVFIIVETVVCIVCRSFVVSQGFYNFACTYYYQVPGLILDLIEVVDFFLNFFTGYLDKESMSIVLEKRKIVKYVFEHFRYYLYFLLSLPFDFATFVLNSSKCHYPLTFVFVMIKIFRLLFLTRYLVHQAKIFNWSELFMRSIWLTLISICILHWLACLFFVIVYDDPEGFPSQVFIIKEVDSIDDYFRRHFKVFYLASSIFFFHTGILNYFYLTRVGDIAFACFILIFTYLSNIVFIGLFVHLLGLLKTPLIHYEGVIQEVGKFLTQENLPRHIHKRVIKYFQFRYQYRYFREKLILDTLSQPLKQEISEYICLGVLTARNSIFANASSDLIRNLCMKMKFEVFLRGDEIIRYGRRGKKIYFVHCGSVVAYSSNGNELAHLIDGDQFGESVFSDYNRNPITAVALEMSELLVLRYQDFENSSDFYSADMAIVVQAANERMRYWHSLANSKKKKKPVYKIHQNEINE